LAIRLVLLGLLLYAPESFLLSQALERVPASIAVFGLYSFPTMVAVMALALGRERLRPAKLAALALSLVGIGLVLSVSTEGIRVLGVLFALGAPCLYAVFVISSQRSAEQVHPVVFTAFVLSGAAVGLFAEGAMTGTIHVPTSHQWGWLLISGAILTVAIGSFALALTHVGPTRAAIGNTFEPP
jgi:drug/metabolite transporter (DMT)-like permease